MAAKEECAEQTTRGEDPGKEDMNINIGNSLILRPKAKVCMHSYIPQAQTQINAREEKTEGQLVDLNSYWGSPGQGS